METQSLLIHDNECWFHLWLNVQVWYFRSQDRKISRPILPFSVSTICRWKESCHSLLNTFQSFAEKHRAKGKTHSGTFLELIMEKAAWQSEADFQRDLINTALSNKNRRISHKFYGIFSSTWFFISWTSFQAN